MEILEHEEKWLSSNGAKMVSTLGVKPGSSVIDFGAGKGRYSIPISQVVGNDGSVLAVERDCDEVTVLRERMDCFGGYESIDILNDEDISLDSVDDKTIDNIFAFDVLQYIDDWEVFFKSLCRVLKTNGSIHIYPAAIPHPGVVDIIQVASLMNNLGLYENKKIEFEMMHNKDMVNDIVYSFILSS